MLHSHSQLSDHGLDDVVLDRVEISSDPDFDLASASSATDGEGSDGTDSDCVKEPLGADALLALLDPADKSLHVVSGDTRVSILTLGWFIERAIVHNLRMFYKIYPATVTRFRQKLYKEFAAGDNSVPCSVVVDRFLAREDALERERLAEDERQLVAEKDRLRLEEEEECTSDDGKGAEHAKKGARVQRENTVSLPEE